LSRCGRAGGTTTRSSTSLFWIDKAQHICLSWRLVSASPGFKIGNEPLAAAGKSAVIPPQANRVAPREFDRELYKERHLVENFYYYAVVREESRNH
jgi:hypothetical protein